MTRLKTISNLQRGSGSFSFIARHRPLRAVSAALVIIASQAGAAETELESRFGAPVNLYAPDATPYALPQANNQIQPWHLRGRAWLMTGGESNVVVHVGDQGVFVIDSGTREMAAEILPHLQRFAEQHTNDPANIRMVVNTNGRASHTGGNQILREAGTQINAGEQARQQSQFGRTGAEVFAHENVLSNMIIDGVDQSLWPTDLAGFEHDSRRFNGEAVQLYRPRHANTNEQLIVLFRESDVLVVGDVVDMRGYPIIDVAQGGTIDGLLVTLNTIINMAVPERQAGGGTLIVPGHGRLADQTDVALYKNMLTIIRNLVQYYKNEGRSLEEVLGLEVTAAYDERWGTTRGSWTRESFVTAVYQTLPANGPVYFSVDNAYLQTLPGDMP